ncbi:hypothetical protein PR048_029599 [Dryococelus australis]|uniref:Uncharacterized protein n=1 Tax=Dryococelus australis TaxID=614101 RepID=A0ABQ9GDV9_9NEOP|nr:hypothetical protein PR048_029599 [Dryococelus australis]
MLQYHQIIAIGVAHKRDYAAISSNLTFRLYTQIITMIFAQFASCRQQQDLLENLANVLSQHIFGNAVAQSNSTSMAAAVAERLDCSPPTYANRVQSPDGPVTRRLDSTDMCLLEPHMFVDWLLPHRVASVTSHLASMALATCFLASLLLDQSRPGLYVETWTIREFNDLKTRLYSLTCRYVDVNCALVVCCNSGRIQAARGDEIPNLEDRMIRKNITGTTLCYDGAPDIFRDVHKSRNDAKISRDFFLRSFILFVVFASRYQAPRYGSSCEMIATRLPRMLTWFDSLWICPWISARGDRTRRCRWSLLFLGDLPFRTPFHSRAAPFLPHFTLIGSQDLDVENWGNGGSGRHLASDAEGPARGTTAARTISPWSLFDACCARHGERLPVVADDTWDKIDSKYVYTEVTFAIGSQIIRHALDDSVTNSRLARKQVASAILPARAEVRDYHIQNGARTHTDVYPRRGPSKHRHLPRRVLRTKPCSGGHLGYAGQNPPRIIMSQPAVHNPAGSLLIAEEVCPMWLNRVEIEAFLQDLGITLNWRPSWYRRPSLPRTIGDQLRMSTILATTACPAVGHQSVANDQFRISCNTASS